MTNNTHGGKRKGAGRPKKSVKAIGFRAPQDIVDILEKQTNRSEYVCSAIRYYYKWKE